MANTYRHIGESNPYYDDWESAQHDDKGYVKVLFKPSVAVQARELNQSQTYLNSQIASLGGYLFKDGTPVSGAKISYVTNQRYAVATISYSITDTTTDAFEIVKNTLLASCKVSNSNYSINEYLLTGYPTVATENTETSENTDTAGTGTASSTVEASYPKIQITGFYEYESEDENANAITALLNADSTGTQTKRVIVLYNLYGGNLDSDKTYIFRTDYCQIRFDSIGTCTTASCTKGVIFVDGYFINVPMSTVLVNPFAVELTQSANDEINQATISSFGLKDISNDDIQYNVGFWIEREVVTAYEDSTLTDPASGSYNYKAPGADRYKILGKLCSLTDDELNKKTDEIEPTEEVDRPVKFVTGIVLKNNVLIKEQNNVGTNSDLMDEMARRTYEESGSYAVTPWKVQIEEDPANDSNYVVSIAPGLGYVYGYRVSNSVSQKFSVEKSRDTIAYKPGNIKYTDSSRYTVTDNLYDDYEYVGVNDNGDNVKKTHSNLKSYNLDTVITASKCYLIDGKISEQLVVYGKTVNAKTGEAAVSNIIEPSTYCGNLSISGDKLMYKSTPTTTTETGLTVVGTVIVTSVDTAKNGALKLYINNADKSAIFNMSSACSLVTADSDNKIIGYVDLSIDKYGVSEWGNNECPFIFETDYNYVANTKDANNNFYVKYSTVIRLSSYSFENVTNTNWYNVSFKLDSNYGAPGYNDIMLLSDNLGNVYNDFEIVGGKSASTDNNSLTLRVNKKNTNTNGTIDNFIIYFDASVEIKGAVFNNGNTTSAVIKEKLLSIATDVIAADKVSDDIQLSNYDLITVLSIKDGTNEILFDENSIDFTPMADKITLVQNANDYCYKKSRIQGIKSYLDSTNSNTNNNTNDISITYAYFKHVGADNGFYSVFSYGIDNTTITNPTNTTVESNPNLINVPGSNETTNIYYARLLNYFGLSKIYAEPTVQYTAITNNIYNIIPIYKSLSGSQYNLANCLDFRKDFDEASNQNFLFNSIPMPTSPVQYNLSIYLPRIDNVWVDKTGNFGITKGIPSENPISPSEIDGSMVLYRLYNRPYGKTINDIIPTYIENKRHTMRDISKLSDRVTALEEVVSMSLIEQSAINLQITDDNGISRYKCGIFTDTFSNFENCNVGDEEWSASIDSVEKSIRPYFTNVDWSLSPISNYYSDLSETTNSESIKINKPYTLVKSTSLPGCTTKFYTAGAGDDTTVTGIICWNDSVITLMPKDLSKDTAIRQSKLTYTNSTDTTASDWVYPSIFSYIYAKNINCTETTNVQSLMFATWSGNLTLFPAIDTWTNDLGDVIATTTYENTEKPATIYRSWTTTSTSSFDTTEVQTVASGMSVADIKKLYGGDKAATEAGKLHQRVVEAGTKVANAIGRGGVGHWEPAETTTTIRSYETTTTTTTTETTTFTGSYVANDVSTYMEQQDMFMRVRFVEFTLKGMRPNSKLYGMMDGIALKLINSVEFAKTETTPETILTSNEYNSITSDSNGDANGYFVVPEKMPVGTKVVQFFDSEKLATCYADYTANGKTVWNSIDRTYIRQWNPVTTQSTKSKTSTPVFTGATRTITATEIFREEDPIAESFYISEENGIMLEAIDIFFASKDPTIGVELFIVECENGYPGQTIVPFSRTFVAAADVKITTEDNTKKYRALPKPTTFKFPVPIFLHPKKEYAFIIIAPSYNYTIYTSSLGKVDLVTNKEIKEQPYTGSMFKSQNLRTWTAEQESDIMFVMYSMKFKTADNTGAGSDVYFGLDDMVSKRTGIKTTLPDTEIDIPFFDMMNISAGTFMPNLTNIEFAYKAKYNGNLSDNNYIKYNNKQDIFFDKPLVLANNSNGANTNTNNTFVNNASTLSIRCTLSTSDENVTPQIDIEDFHGIFSRNIISSTPQVKFDNLDYYKAGTYISNSILLKEPAIGLKVLFDAILPNNSKIKTYYKLTNIVSKYNTLIPASVGNGFINTIVYDMNNITNPVYAEYSYKLTSQIGLNVTDTSNNTYMYNSISGKKCNIWYHVYDNIDRRYKFICPSQINSTSTLNYGLSVFIPTVGSTIKPLKNTSINVYSVQVDKTNSPTAFKKVSIRTETSDDNTNTNTFSYVGATSSNYSIVGIYAIPIESAMPSPEDVVLRTTDKMKAVINSEYLIGTQVDDGDTTTTIPTIIDSYFKTITCADYDSTHTYLPGQMCINKGKLFINGSDTLSITGVEPTVNTETGWKQIPCMLLIGEYSVSDDVDSTWIELTAPEYKNTTERETNFMEYMYSSIESPIENSTSSEELNSTSFADDSFDEFRLKIELYCKDQCNVPRFRNLRAIAVV